MALLLQLQLLLLLQQESNWHTVVAVITAFVFLVRSIVLLAVIVVIDIIMGKQMKGRWYIPYEVWMTQHYLSALLSIITPILFIIYFTKNRSTYITLWKRWWGTCIIATISSLNAMDWSFTQKDYSFFVVLILFFLSHNSYYCWRQSSSSL